MLSSHGHFEMEDHQTRLSEARDVSDCVSEPFDSASGVMSEVRKQSSDVPSANSDPPDVESQQVVPTYEDTGPDELAVCIQPQGFENTVARTRRGRVINPPKRLICEMNEQVLDTSESTVNSFLSLVKRLF